ncbi:MAG TPA: deoxyribose-phosphate aldolase [Euzebya sp.]|nr:deoxyribose-phosphate aldolase [Euzebya sp.]
MTTPDLHGLRATRVTDPDAVLTAAQRRTRRPLGARMMLIAADHPARGSLGVRDNPMAMADREDLLARLVTALAIPGVDGVLGTADVLEDLLLLGALEGKVVIGSMNRGGLQGSAFELDDRFTGYDAAGIATMGFDGGKMLTRIALDEPDSVATLEACAHAVNDLAAHGLMAMVEPFMSTVVGGRVVNDLSSEAVQRSVAIASGLGTTSRHTWLKLPVVDEGMDEVCRATTMPILLLGGDPSGPAEENYERWEQALDHDGVQGLIVGRALLYPPDGDVAAAVTEAVRMVHRDVDQAVTPA